MQAEVDGEYRIYPNRIELMVTKADIHISTHCPYKGRDWLSSIRIGLATYTDGKQWKITTASPELFTDQIMSPGDVRSLGELHFDIPTAESIDLSKHWLVVKMEDVDVDSRNPVTGWAYAHSDRDIFSKPK